MLRRVKKGSLRDRPRYLCSFSDRKRGLSLRDSFLEKGDKKGTDLFFDSLLR
jgi:hypothetical protein